jgi:hypothetical protein
LSPVDLASVGFAVSAVAAALHGAAAFAYRPRAAGVPGAAGEATGRKARALGGGWTALAYLLVSSLALAGIRLPGMDGVTAGSLLVFTITQVLWLLSTTLDVLRHFGAAGGGAG